MKNMNMKNITLIILLLAKGWAASAQNNAIFTGGEGDGWSVAIFLQPSVNIFAGGMGDGYSANNFLQPGNNIYNGGNGDGWSSAYKAMGPLPLHLISFTVTKSNNKAALQWQTTNEVNTAWFNIQRSQDGTTFTTVGKVNANNHAGLQNKYVFDDDVSALNTGKVYYRLQMMDNDGQFTFSKIAYITIEHSRKSFTIYPNPAHGDIIIGNYSASDIMNAQIVIRDLAGHKLITRKFTRSAEQKINLGSLAKGVYIISIITPGNVQTQKLVVE